MPKIDAPTVAEHNTQRRAAILEAAVDLLNSDGIGGLTPAAVAAASGLARSSVYQYYPSTGALIAAGVTEIFQRTGRLIEEGQVGATTPEERIVAWVDSALEAAGAGHEPMKVFASGDLPAECRAAVVGLHRELTEPLVSALEDQGVEAPAAVAELVGGVMSAAAAQVARGEGMETVRARVRAFVLSALGVTGP